MAELNEAEEKLVDLTLQMVLALVDDRRSVRVGGQQRNGCTVVHVRMADGDVGKVIGKQGRTARSLRTILAAASMKLRVRCELNIVEPGEEVS